MIKFKRQNIISILYGGSGENWFVFSRILNV